MTKIEFTNIITPFKDKLYYLALRLLKDKQSAEDIVQSVLLKLWENKDQINSFKNAEYYSMKMTKNLCLDKIKNKHSQVLSIGERDFFNNENVQKEIETKDSLQNVKNIINKLPENQKSLFIYEV